MKIYFVSISDFDLYSIEGIFFSRKNAENRFDELKNDPRYLWKKYLQIEERITDDEIFCCANVE